MRKLYVNRIHTNLVGVISDTDRMKYSSLASISQAGHTTLTPAFTQAIDSAKRAADAAYQQHLGNAPQQRGQGRVPVQRGRGPQRGGAGPRGRGARGRGARGRG